MFERINLKLTAVLLIGMALLFTLSSSTFAQTATNGNTTTTTAGNSTADNGPADGPGGGKHGKGGPGMDGSGKGGRGGRGNALLQATTAISSTTADLGYAKGKMDTSTASDLLGKAQGFLAQAQTLNSQTAASRKANETAAAAADAAAAASHQIAANLGASNLPSTANRPARPANTVTDTAQLQAHVSRDLAHTYSEITEVSSKAKTTTGLGDQSYYINLAQAAYKLAYAAYTAGKYEQANEYSRMADDSIGVVEHLIRALEQGAGGNSTTPTTPPSPSFP